MDSMVSDIAIWVNFITTKAWNHWLIKGIIPFYGIILGE